MVSSSPADESRRLGNLVSYIFDLSRPGPAREQVLRITDADTDVVYAQNVANCLHEVRMSCGSQLHVLIAVSGCHSLLTTILFDATFYISFGRFAVRDE
jgi:hypothetical protein